MCTKYILLDMFCVFWYGCIRSNGRSFVWSFVKDYLYAIDCMWQCGKSWGKVKVGLRGNAAMLPAAFRSCRMAMVDAWRTIPTHEACPPLVTLGAQCIVGKPGIGIVFPPYVHMLMVCTWVYNSQGQIRQGRDQSGLQSSNGCGKIR